jgi:hypothetical protein
LGAMGAGAGLGADGGGPPGLAAGPPGCVVFRGGSLGAAGEGTVGRPGTGSAARFGCE